MIMTTIKDYLNSAYTLNASIESARVTLKNLDSFPFLTKTVSDKLNLVQSELNTLIQEQTIKKLNIYNLINKLDDEILKSILSYKYICFLSFEEISKKMHYSTRHIIRLHNKAIETLKERSPISG